MNSIATNRCELSWKIATRTMRKRSSATRLVVPFLLIFFSFGWILSAWDVRSAEAGCRGYIQFRAFEKSVRGLELPVDGHDARRMRRSSVVSVVDQEMPCHGPQCQAPPERSPPLPSPLAGWPSSQPTDATIALSTPEQPIVTVFWFVPADSVRVSGSALDRLDRPPRA